MRAGLSFVMTWRGTGNSFICLGFDLRFASEISVRTAPEATGGLVYRSRQALIPPPEPIDAAPCALHRPGAAHQRAGPGPMGCGFTAVIQVDWADLQGVAMQGLHLTGDLFDCG